MNSRALKKTFLAADWPDVSAQTEYAGLAAQLPPRDLEELLPSLMPARGTSVDQRRARFAVWTMIIDRAPDRALFLPMWRLAVKGDMALLRVLQPLLVKCNDIAAHPEVVRLLKSSDSALRRFAAELLREAGGRTALAELERTLSGSGWSNRQDAMELAMALGGHYAIPIVGGVVGVGDVSEVVGALRLLSDPRYVKGSPRLAIEAIEPALTSPQSRVVVEAMKALSRIAPPDVFYDQVEPFLHSEDPRLRRAAVECLAKAPSVQTLQLLSRLYAISDQGTREVILGVMEQIGDDSALPMLIEALGDPALAIRNRATEVVVRLARDAPAQLACDPKARAARFEGLRWPGSTPSSASWWSNPPATCTCSCSTSARRRCRPSASTPPCPTS